MAASSASPIIARVWAVSGAHITTTSERARRSCSRAGANQASGSAPSGSPVPGSR